MVVRRVGESRRAQVGMAGSGSAVGGDSGCRERWWKFRWWEVLVGESGEGKERSLLGWMFNVAPRWKSTNGREWWSEV